jgi:F0F1-type ATP synthase membrane subunit c/vacuolar-type H+-ATPase subunit K
MTPVRRIAAAALVAVLGVGVAAIGASPAQAYDTSWGAKITTRN